MTGNEELRTSQLREEVEKEVKSRTAKALVAGGIVLLTFSVAGWWLYLKPKIVELAGGVPKGAVIAFSTDCPKVGWKPYERAYGRFIRGIDLGKQELDPSGIRNFGDYQADSIAMHSHPLESNIFMKWDGSSADVRVHGSRQSEPGRLHLNAPIEEGKLNSGGSSETRPKNVALLYCEKIQ